MRYLASHIGKDVEAGMMFLFSGYLSDIEKRAGDLGVELDMTYETSPVDTRDYNWQVRR